jgi:hypothetical protein
MAGKILTRSARLPTNFAAPSGRSRPKESQMSDQEKFEGATEETAEAEVHLMRDSASEKLIQRSDDGDDTPDVEGHLSLRNGPEARINDAEKPSV